MLSISSYHRIDGKELLAAKEVLRIDTCKHNTLWRLDLKILANQKLGRGEIDVANFRPPWDCPSFVGYLLAFMAEMGICQSTHDGPIKCF